MRYGVAENIPDFGFRFFEKLHEPIFLVNKVGAVRNANEAGRKFLKIGHVLITELEALSTKFRNDIENLDKTLFLRKHFPHLGIQLIAQNLKNSEYILVEVRKCSKSIHTFSDKDLWLSKISSTDS